MSIIVDIAVELTNTNTTWDDSINVDKLQQKGVIENSLYSNKIKFHPSRRYLEKILIEWGKKVESEEE